MVLRSSYQQPLLTKACVQPVDCLILVLIRSETMLLIMGCMEPNTCKVSQLWPDLSLEIGNAQAVSLQLLERTVCSKFKVDRDRCKYNKGGYKKNRVGSRVLAKGISSGSQACIACTILQCHQCSSLGRVYQLDDNDTNSMIWTCSSQLKWLYLHCTCIENISLSSKCVCIPHFVGQLFSRPCT